MNQRQKIKQEKKWFKGHGFDTRYPLTCINCGATLSWKDELQKSHGVCSEYCYMISVGLSLSDFI